MRLAVPTATMARPIHHRRDACSTSVCGRSATAACPRETEDACQCSAISDIKMRHALEFRQARFNLRRREPEQTAQAKLLDGEAGHHRAVHQRAAQVRLRMLTGASQMPHEAAGEAVACSCRIMDLLERIAGSKKDAVVHEQAGPVFTALH